MGISSTDTEGKVGLFEDVSERQVGDRAVLLGEVEAGMDVEVLNGHEAGMGHLCSLGVSSGT